MSHLAELRERRNERARETRNLLDVTKGKTWAEDNQKKYDLLIAEIGDLDTQISREQKVLDLEADIKAPTLGADDRRELENRAVTPVGIYDTWLRRGNDGFSAEQLAAVKNAMSTTTGSEGGFTVQTEVAATLMDALKAYGGVRKVADVFRTAQGNDLNYPTSDGTSETGELIGQNVTATVADAVFGVKTITPYKFSSKIIAVPIELLQDSQIDMEAFVRQRLATRLGRVTNTFFTTGTGTSQPNGVVTASSSGKVGTTGQTLTVIFDDLVDLVHSVDPAYRELGNCRFMMNDGSVKVVRKLKDTAGRPIWIPSYDAGVRGAVPDELLGYPIQVNQDVAVMAANAKSILFGDFMNYKIRDVMEVSMFRFTDSAYMKLGQIAFLAWMRSGGQYVDVGNSLKYYQNSAS